MTTTTLDCAPAADSPVWTNEPRRPGVISTSREVWQHRRFLKYLAARSMRKLYRRTALGIAWVFITPLFPIVVRVAIFGGLFGVNGDGVPYFLFFIIGNLCWDFFASALMWSTRGLEMNRSVLSRVYVPKIIMPIATMAPSIVDFLINLAVFIAAAAYYQAKDGTTHLALGAQTLWSVAALTCMLFLAIGIGLFTSIWGEKARDARFTMAQVLTFWFLLTPVLYPVTILSPQHMWWLLLNPMAAFVTAFKYGVIPSTPPDPYAFGLGVAMTLATVSFGLVFFARREMGPNES